VPIGSVKEKRKRRGEERGGKGRARKKSGTLKNMDGGKREGKKRKKHAIFERRWGKMKGGEGVDTLLGFHNRKKNGGLSRMKISKKRGC